LVVVWDDYRLSIPSRVVFWDVVGITAFCQAVVATIADVSEEKDYISANVLKITVAPNLVRKIGSGLPAKR
jgi:hypothetical protein